MEQQRVTVLGGSGFIGRYVVERLADQGAVVTVAVRDPEGAKFLKPLGQVGQVAPIAVNVRDTAALARAVEGADAVINLVGILYKTGRQTFKTLHTDVPAAIDGYRVCRIENFTNRSDIPNACELSTLATSVCDPTATPDCTDLAVTVPAGEVFYYQTKGLCAGLEGP